MTETMEEHERKIKETEQRFGVKWEELFHLVNTPCGDALDKLWQDIILKKNPNYGDWQYPGMVYRHLFAEYQGLKAENERLLGDMALRHFNQVSDATIQVGPSSEGWTIRFFTEAGQVTITCDADHLRTLGEDIQRQLKKVAHP